MNMIRSSVLFALFLVVGCSGCTGRSHIDLQWKTSPALNQDSDFPELRNVEENRERQRLANQYLEQKMEDITVDLKDYPYLAAEYLNPAKAEIEALQKMDVTDPKFPEMFNQLHSDMENIYKLEGFSTT